MQHPVFLYGAGGHAKVILEILEEEGRTIGGVYDDNPALRSVIGYPVVTWTGQFSEDSELIVSIGDNRIRKYIADGLNTRFTRATHRNSYLSPRCGRGPGTVIMSGVSIHSGAETGRHCIINTHASVDHDCTLADFVHIAPHAVLCGHVHVGEGTLVGAGAVVVPGVRIGKWVQIGAGAVVRKDIPDYATVVGNPGRIFYINDNPDKNAR